ncbi:ANTAR domain-containing response regulator [Phytohabitans kaempferiae]|uniref:ANTAR domain-containing response regulator n=1 Tax=Phytohabitans kaempferiae TaxID=1620943 RepID=A0ABV6M0E9_9ACTN
MRDDEGGRLDPALDAVPPRTNARAAEPRRRVVIAEDEAIIRLDLAEMLLEEGYEVIGQAGDGRTAIELTEELRPDLVIVDIKMPIMDGIAVAERVAGSRLAPVIILTGFSQRDLVERAREAGAMAYLLKPFQKDELGPAIAVALSRFTELNALEAEASTLAERLLTHTVVERAKAKLITERGMAEPDAFTWLQEAAATHELTLREIAERIVAETTGDTGSAEPG